MANKYEFEYNMEHLSRGLGLIINNTKFHPSTRMPDRGGSDKDAIRLYDLFESYSFDTKLYHNQSTTDIMRIMQDVAKTDHGECDAFAIAILSHGDNGLVYGTDGILYLDTITEQIKGPKCKSLAGKPKLFFIQACRGHNLDHGVEVADASEEPEDNVQIRRIPSEADFLMFYSTVPGYFSWRNSSEGSYFIRALCRVLSDKNNYGKDLMMLLTRVNQIVAFDFESNTSNPDMHQKKQIPSIVSMLTKQVLLKPKPIQ